MSQLIDPGALAHWWTDEAGVRRPVLAWDGLAGNGSAARPWRAVSSAVVGGGIGPIGWWLNAQVDLNYSHPDPAAHAGELAAGLGLAGDGVAMLTAADVLALQHAGEGGVEVVATVGLGLPVPAAAPAQDLLHEVGTINVLVLVPAVLSDAALVNLVITATEAKTQALVEAGVPGTGTSSDAVCVAARPPAGPAAGAVRGPGAGPGAGRGPVPDDGLYGGPRSVWGARAARAVHRAVAAGTAEWLRRHPPGDAHRFWPG